NEHFRRGIGMGQRIAVAARATEPVLGRAHAELRQLDRTKYIVAFRHWILVGELVLCGLTRLNDRFGIEVADDLHLLVGRRVLVAEIVESGAGFFRDEPTCRLAVEMQTEPDDSIALRVLPPFIYGQAKRGPVGETLQRVIFVKEIIQLRL